MRYRADTRCTAACELIVASTWNGEAIALSEQVRVRLRFVASGLRIAVSAPFHGDPPPPGAPGSTDGLWQHEVVELFVAGPADDDGIPYTEIELSPWGHHLVLQLHGVRNRVAAEPSIAFRACRRGRRWLGAARVDLALLPPQPWRANAFAIHGVGDARRYLAATPLPGERPDFHQPANFPAIAIAPPE